MGNHTYLCIVIRIIALAYSVQIVAGTEALSLFLSNPINAIISGLVVCITEILIIGKVLGDQHEWLWKPLGARSLWQGLLAFVLVLMITTLCVDTFDQHKILAGVEDLPMYLLVFFLNLVPNALIEEWIFRFFPTVIAQRDSRLRCVDRSGKLMLGYRPLQTTSPPARF